MKLYLFEDRARFSWKVILPSSILPYVRRPTPIPWGALQMQFGADYPHTHQGRRNFKKAFLNALRKVQVVYPEVRLDETPSALLLLPSRNHVAR
jgi:hypothetical protein